MRDCIYEEIVSARDHDRANQDLSAQQQMALFTKIMGWTAVVGLIIGCGSVVLIFLTLRATQEMASDQAKIGSAQIGASLDAIKTAQEANQIMRDERRPWLDITASPSGQLIYMPDSNTLAIPFDIIIQNMGKGPAFNVAIELGLAAVPDEGQGVLGGDAQFALNKRLIESAQRRSKNNNMTTTIFPDHPHNLNRWLAHAHFVRDGVKDGQKFGLIVAITVAYGPAKNPCYISILPGPILHGSESGLFGFTVDDIKAGKGAFSFTIIEKAKLI
jgi:hypothetical protein